ncbi:hypothetical protein L596_029112 [Steinernema carpocapsae]|uniref:Uncharacterized protein n=1 Tax=Steinernema carpocapsae TaxID=34508 RepID=A0A4U5LTP5_STECR|nr:hypothetical protein L596_029112 [Steinernema carpocapsae]
MKRSEPLRKKTERSSAKAARKARSHRKSAEMPKLVSESKEPLPSALAVSHSNSESLADASRREHLMLKQREAIRASREKIASPVKPPRRTSFSRILDIRAPRPIKTPLPRNCIRVRRYRTGNQKHSELRFVSYNHLTHNETVDQPLNLCDVLTEVALNSKGAFADANGISTSPILMVYLNMARISGLRKLNEQLQNEKVYLDETCEYLEQSIESRKNIQKTLKANDRLLEDVADSLNCLADEKIECDAATGHLHQGVQLHQLVQQMKKMKVGATATEKKDVVQRVTKLRRFVEVLRDH